MLNNMRKPSKGFLIIIGVIFLIILWAALTKSGYIRNYFDIEILSFKKYYLSQEIPSDFNILMCKIRGGKYEAVGMRGSLMCVFSYSDAGKKCRDSSDCKGRCLLTENSPEYFEWENNRDISVTGNCEKENNSFGCFASIIDGHSDGFWCSD